MSIFYFVKMKIAFLVAVWKTDWGKARMEPGEPHKWSRGGVMRTGLGW